jgi:hypothetical protein
VPHNVPDALQHDVAFTTDLLGQQLSVVRGGCTHAIAAAQQTQAGKENVREGR